MKGCLDGSQCRTDLTRTRIFYYECTEVVFLSYIGRLLALMDTVQDFLKDLKERLSNPLISSFVIAWLLANWPITVGLLFYKIEDLERDGYKSYYLLIKGNYSFLHMVVLPSVVALLYTFLFPHVKAYIKLSHARITAQNDSDIQDATKDGIMPVRKYLAVKAEMEAAIKDLQHLVDTENTVHAEANRTKTVNLGLEKVNNELAHQLNTKVGELAELNHRAKSTFLMGNWKVEITYISGSIEEHVWRFSVNMIAVGMAMDPVYECKFVINPLANEAMLDINYLSSKKHFGVFKMHGNSDLTTFETVDTGFGIRSFKMTRDHSLVFNDFQSDRPTIGIVG